MAPREDKPAVLGPYQGKLLRTALIRVPPEDWIDVTRGNKTEFRTRRVPYKRKFYPPQPAVLVRSSEALGWASKLMVLEGCWDEPLGAIGPESLRREGCADMAEFRRRWVAKAGRPFEPMRTVRVFRVRSFTDEDRAALADRLLEHLYGEWL